MDKVYHVIRSEEAKLGRFKVILDIVDQEGSEYPYSYVDQKDSVGILGMIGNRFILIRQYRHSMNYYEYEIVGGGIESGEKPVEVAYREMLEETGYEIKDIDELGAYYPSPGSSNEVCYLFSAKCEKLSEPTREPLEYMSVELVGEEDFVKMIKNGSFRHSMGLVAWLKYCIKRGYL
ncbi:MAG: NUDIX hydrolase [Saccharofermentanales bacterium]|jgi:ADP-ribose pyrophosphatase